MLVLLIEQLISSNKDNCSSVVVRLLIICSVMLLIGWLWLIHLQKLTNIPPNFAYPPLQSKLSLTLFPITWAT